MVEQVDWRHFFPLLASESSRDSLWLSLETSAISTLLCVLIGTPMALVLARTSFPGQRVVRAIVLLPLVLPPVVGGLALLDAFGRRGLLGHTMEVLGINIAFTTAAVVMAQTFVALPFLVISLEGALRTFGTRYDEVAATLGAGPTTVMRRVTLPLVGPSMTAGIVLCFARALGEFGATITFAGSLQGRTATVPVQIYLSFNDDSSQATVLGVVLIAVAVVVIAVAGRRITGGTP